VATDPISAFEASRPQPHESAADHVERDLQAVENDRLRRENAALKSALRAAGRVLSPYIINDGARRR
jgi:hypothetical protein